MDQHQYEDGISNELRDGIRAWEAKVAPIVGRRVTIAGLDGTLREGVFGQAAVCQPVVTDADGRRWMVPVAEVDRLAAGTDIVCRESEVTHD